MSEAEEVMTAIWREHLNGQHIEVDDDFYALGGDSLIALRVVADAKRQGFPIELRDLLYFPTVGELVKELAGREEQAGDDPGYAPFDLLDPFDRALLPPGVRDAWPASALQVGIIYLCEAAADPELYQDLVSVEVRGRFDERIFRTALGALCERHQALRSSFDLGGYSVPLQLLWSAVEPPLSVEYAESADAVRRWRAAERRRSIDWGSAPVLRCHVVVLATGFHVTLAIHHAVIDGWSFARLWYELLALYDAGLRGEPADLPAPPATAQREFVRLERAAVEDPAAADFWHAEADVPPLLVDRGRLAGPADPREVLAFPVDDELLAGLHRTAEGYGVPVKSLVLGCHLAALSTWCDRDRDVVTGLTVNGRPEMSGGDLVVGLFLNTVPLRLRAVPADTRGLAHAALAAEQRLMRYRRYPLARIEQRLDRPAFDVAFNFTHFHVYRGLRSLTELQTGQWWSFDKASFPMMVDFMIESRGSGTGVAVAYDPALIDPAAASRYAMAYEEALRSAVRVPKR